MKTIRRKAALVVGAVLLLACSHTVPRGGRNVEIQGHRTPVSQAELQQDLQRFTGSFADRLVQSAAPLADPKDPRLAEQVMRRVLMYDSSALDIATGQVPEINLLDMLVFVTLVRESFEQYWLPEVFGERGRDMLRALETSERELWELSSKVLSEQQQQDLRNQIATWREQNPKQVRVEAVRLSDFSKMAGAAALAKQSSGMLSTVKSVTNTADEAILLGERALFLAQRMPFLMRMQMRVGAQELLSDSQLPLKEGDALLARAQHMLQDARGLRPLLADTKELITSLRALTSEARQLAESVEPLHASLEPLLSERQAPEGHTVTGIERLVESSQELSERARVLLEHARALMPDDPQAARSFAIEVDRTLVRWMVYVALLGTFLSAIFWLGFYLVKRATTRST